VRAAVEITSADVILQPVAPSFHARDVLAPASAHLAAGAPIESLGPPLDPDGLVDLAVAEPGVELGKIECEVLDMNRLGKVQLNVRTAHLTSARLADVDAFLVESTAGSAFARRVATYADVEPGDWGLMLDPRGWISVIRGNPANAAEGLGVQSGDLVWIREAPPEGEAPSA
jgi:S-adenosylmethionine hydrolase